MSGTESTVTTVIRNITPRSRSVTKRRKKKPCVLGQPETHVVRTGDDVALSVRLHRPYHRRSSAKVIVLVHGFAGEKTENGLFDFIGRALAKRGMCVAAYDWRGLGDSEGNFAESTLDQHARDLFHVRRWASRQTQRSERSLLFLGFSLGTALLLRARTFGLESEGFAFLSPAVRLQSDMWPRYASLAQQAHEHGPQKKPGSQVLLSYPILDCLQADLSSDLAELEEQLLVLHGTEDSRIPVDSSRALFSQRSHASCKYVELKGASHSFRPDDQNWSKVSQYLLQWIATLPRSN